MQEPFSLNRIYRDRRLVLLLYIWLIRLRRRRYGFWRLGILPMMAASSSFPILPSPIRTSLVIC